MSILRGGNQNNAPRVGMHGKEAISSCSCSSFVGARVVIELTAVKKGGQKMKTSLASHIISFPPSPLSAFCLPWTPSFAFLLFHTMGGKYRFVSLLFRLACPPSF